MFYEVFDDGSRNVLGEFATTEEAEGFVDELLAADREAGEQLRVIAVEGELPPEFDASIARRRALA